MTVLIFCTNSSVMATIMYRNGFRSTSEFDLIYKLSLHCMLGGKCYHNSWLPLVCYFAHDSHLGIL